MRIKIKENKKAFWWKWKKKLRKKQQETKDGAGKKIYRSKNEEEITHMKNIKETEMQYYNKAEISGKKIGKNAHQMVKGRIFNYCVKFNPLCPFLQI